VAQRNRDIEQDIRDILITRERMTEKIELLKAQLRGAARQTQYQLGQAIDEVKQTAEGFKRTLNPYYQIEHHPWAITAGVILLGYVLAQWGRDGSRTRGNGHLTRQTSRSFYDLVRKVLPGRG
jgi:ElaB/YqjD/DUF883 family membrane-anchored ribosome-binding protein